MMKRFVAVLSAALLALGLAACDKLPGRGDDAPANSTPAVSTPTPAASTPAGGDGSSIDSHGRESGDISFGDVGERMENVFFAFTVNSVERTDTFGGAGSQAPAGYDYLVVNLTIENTFGDTLPMFDSDFWIEWGEGDDEGCYPVEVVDDSQLPAEYEIEADGTTTGNLVFEIPEDASISEYWFVYLEVYNDDFTGNYNAVVFEV